VKMPVMAVNSQNQQTGDYRSRPRWSARALAKCRTVWFTGL
jgi:hypothetical protein